MDQFIRQRRPLRVKLKFVIFILQIIHLDSNAQSLDLEQCTMPLGMESGEIQDTDLSASSSFEHGNVGAHIGRVRKELQGGAWCPKNQITSEAEEWLQIDLHTTRVITMTETQGRFGNGQGQEFAESYLISYWRPQLNKWMRYRAINGNEGILKGNINTYLASKTELNPPIIASKIRIIPYSYHRRTVCLRVEIYGCLYRGGLLSYTMPQGSKRGVDWELYDHTYDGIWDGKYLQNGLGQLTDGRGGPVNFKDDFYGPERGKGWVGWKNESRNSTDPLEITFNFDSVREFNAVHIHVSNQFTKDIQVFSRIFVFFSVGGKVFSRDPILYSTVEDCIFEDPKNVTIKLHHRIGQYLKIQLFWSPKTWILISEITFDSQPAMGNFTKEGIEMTTVNKSKDAFSSQNDASRRVLIDNPPLPINVANSIIDQTPPEDFTSTTIVMTAVISSFVAIVLVLLMILVAFLMRHKLFIQDKIPPMSQSCSMNYGDLGFKSVGNGGGHQSDFGYEAPVVLLASRDLKSKSPPTMASSLSRDYEPLKPSFSSFVGSNANNNTAKSNGGSTSSGNNSKMAEYYSSVIVPNATFCSKTDIKTNEYEYMAQEADLFINGLVPANRQKSPSRRTGSTTSPLMQSHRSAIHARLMELGLPDIPKQKLKLLRKLGEGVFGEMCIGELQMSNNPMDRHLVAVKRLLRNATDKDKLDLIQEVRILSSLDDPNVTQVLGVCTEEEPFSVILEYLAMGDLCQFLRGNDTLTSSSKRKLSSGDLLHLATQIASGMKFLECKSIVHRDLAARNCVVSRCLTVKISHFATDTGLYAQDYYRIDGNNPMPIRWMSWESVFIGKYSTKSDIWSFGILLFEILTFCRNSPYPLLTDQEVIHNLRRLSFDDESDPYEALEHPYNCPRDLYQLMCDTWRRNDLERPTFWEIHCFLMRKNMKYNNIPHHQRNTSSAIDQQTSYYV